MVASVRVYPKELVMTATTLYVPAGIGSGTANVHVFPVTVNPLAVV